MENILVEFNENEINLVTKAVQKSLDETEDFASKQKGDAYKIAMGRAKTLAIALAKLYDARRKSRLQTKTLTQ